jgi:hypothetical protein
MFFSSFAFFCGTRGCFRAEGGLSVFFVSNMENTWKTSQYPIPRRMTITAMIKTTAHAPGLAVVWKYLVDAEEMKGQKFMGKKIVAWGKEKSIKQ